MREWWDRGDVGDVTRPRWRPTAPARRRYTEVTPGVLVGLALACAVIAGWTGYVTGRQHPSGYTCPFGTLTPTEVPTGWVKMGTGLWFSDGKPVAFSAPAGEVCVFA